ncbi:MAG: mismatch repair protein MutL [Desulfonauticus sp.]|jgi:DNA mismatch repair protein MutL|nr:mismatch repair protein MutL [Desulfonauticus sp.]
MLRPSIKILPPEVQNQIAAGEVVERPASVLKELLENSLDALATSVKVYLQRGGLELIQVEDNGVGIPEEELELALTRHATSKISFFPDLLSISTYGFRGEALPSIASVSQLSLSSKTLEQESGMAVEVHFGQLLKKYPLSHPPGTRVKVENLFLNVPARLKFLKTPATEKNKCIQAFIREALPHTQVEFLLFVEGKEHLHFYKQEKPLLRLQKIWPESITQNLLEFNLKKEDITISGYTSKPESIQARANRIFVYVNNRPVQDKIILKAIREAYAGKILRNEFPQTLLFIHIPPELVDVNVHPAKTEVRFTEEGLIFSLVKKALEQVLSPKITYSFEVKEEIKPALMDKKEFSLPLTEKDISEVKEVAENKAPYTPTSLEEKYSEPAQKDNLIYLGQIDSTYLLLKDRENFLLLDQHAVHERILFEELKNKKIEKKHLLLPLTIKLSLSEQECFQELFGYLSELGFSGELKENILHLKTIPGLLTPEQSTSFLKEILVKKIDKYEELLKIMACKGSIKAKATLTTDEALGLILKWQRCPNNSFCPHGRPTSLPLRAEMFHALFKRT